MSTMESADYKSRKVQDWLILANDGIIVLPTYQRSYVWKRNRIADYLKALFDNRPTGTFLLLKSKGEEKFKSRTLKGITADPNKAEEYLLDGQQRLTSLWHVIKGESDYVFYVEVDDLKRRKMDVRRVRSYLKTSTDGKPIRDPRNAYQKNLVPIVILSEDSGIEDSGGDRDPDDPGRIWDWCRSACDHDMDEAARLRKAIQNRLKKKLLGDRYLHYCALPSSTESNVAINIFIETNQSSAKIKQFDIVVARAQAVHEEDLRKHIVEFRQRYPLLQHYFSHDKETMIPEVGEWLLKVACLRVREQGTENGLPPKESNYEDALHGLFKGDKNTGLQRLKKLQGDLKAALDFVTQRGGSTKRTLPAWPPVHVIAALQDDLRSIRTPAWRGTANKLISAYLWRSFLTDRYRAQANDRLFKDYKKLKRCLEQIKLTGNYSNLPPIFRDDDHPPPNALVLKKPLQWIGHGRLGPAVAAVVMQKNPLDWVTGDRLDAATVRDLENRRKLDRHHVFPSAYLGKDITPGEKNHGLNGVLLSKEGNISLGKKAPDVYLQKILDQSHGLSDIELRSRVESHLIPYDALRTPGTPKRRYKNFIRQRADLVAAEIRRLVAP